MTVGPVRHLVTVTTVLHVYVKPQQYLLGLRQLHLLHELRIRGQNVVHGLIPFSGLFDGITLPEHLHPQGDGDSFR